MRAWLLDSLQGIEKLRLGEAPDPQAAEGEVVLQLTHAALNPADRYLAQGQYPANPPLPHILGRDGAGTVIEIGPGVEDLQVGDCRAILRGDIGVSRAGTFAQRVAVPAQSLVEIPAGWSQPQAASATLVYLTAYQALTQWEELSQAVVLISGASGGVGVAAIQLAQAMGHSVIALSRSAEKRQRLMELGATLALDPDDPQWRAQLKQKLAGRRVDLAIDNIGGELFAQLIDTLADHGRVSVVGRLAGPAPQFNTASLLFRRLRIGGVAVGAYTNADSRSAWAQILRLMGKTGAKPLIDSVFAFEQLPQAFDRLAQGPIGKVALSIAGDTLQRSNACEGPNAKTPAFCGGL